MLKYTVWQPGRQDWWISNGWRPPRNIHTCACMHTRTHTQTITTSCSCSEEGKKKDSNSYFCTFCTLVFPLLSTVTGGGGRRDAFFIHVPWERQTDSKYVRYCVVYYWFGLFIIHTLSLQPPLHLSPSLSPAPVISVSGNLKIQILNLKLLFYFIQIKSSI